MKKIKLFLTSSLRELERDLAELGAFVADLNDRYASQNIYFQLNISGEGDFAEDVEAAQNSELFYIIFHDEPQDRARAEFEAAYAAFHEKKTPKIITYYKQLDRNQPEDTALAFMDKLRNELGHFNSKYTHIDTVKLNVVLQLKSLGLEHIKVDVKGSSLILDDKELTTLTLDNIPMIFNNKNLTALKEEYARLDIEYWSLRKRMQKDRDDEEAWAAYPDVSRRKKEREETIHSLQMNVITTASSLLEKDGTGVYSQRYMLARQCLEEGDIDGADQALKEEELEQEEVLEQEKSDEEKKIRQALVENRLLRVNVLKMKIEKPNRFTEIEHNFEKAIKLEKDWGLERKSLRLYAVYLYKQNHFGKALEYAQLYLHWLESEEKEEDEIAFSCNLIAICYNGLHRFKEAEELYKKALGIRERLAKESPAAFEPYLALSCNNLALLYKTTQRYPEAEELYKKALAVYGRLAKERPAAFEPYLALSCNNLASLYYTTQRYPEAEELYKKALGIRGRLAKESPAAFEPDLAGSCNNLALLYKTTQRYPEAEELYKKALVVYGRLMINIPMYTDSYNSTLLDLVYLLHDMEKYEEAEPLYFKLISLREKLAAENLELYEGSLALALNNLGSMYRKMQRYTEAEPLYNRALDIRKKLLGQNPDDSRSRNNLASQLYRFGLLYEQTERLQAAQATWQQALDIWETMNEDGIGDYTEEFENTRNKLTQGAV
ncbi:MAG: tetratricopeptide repeat protein [Treponema sp.]|jgi:tetratricopeptide (TPR) repeat protein|nr:tetratricopeptide repeat protein [Treponema sp.]